LIAESVEYSTNLPPAHYVVAKTSAWRSSILVLSSLLGREGMMQRFDGVL